MYSCAVWCACGSNSICFWNYPVGWMDNKMSPLLPPTLGQASIATIILISILIGIIAIILLYAYLEDHHKRP